MSNENDDGPEEDEGREAEGQIDATTLERMKAAAPRLYNGTWTVSHAGLGQHYTVKLWTRLRGKYAGDRTIGLLVGPDNVRDFRAVATWDDKAGEARVFRAYRAPLSRFPIDGRHWQNGDEWSKVEKKLSVWLDLALRAESGRQEVKSFWAPKGYTLQRSARCVKCNRVLTEPLSLKLGIGPICATRSRP